MLVYQACHIMFRIMRYGLIDVIFKDCAVRSMSMRQKTQDGRNIHQPSTLACHTTLWGHIRVLCLVAPSRNAHTQVCRTHKSHAEIFQKHMPHDVELNLMSLIHQHAACDP